MKGFEIFFFRDLAMDVVEVVLKLLSFNIANFTETVNTRLQCATLAVLPSSCMNPYFYLDES